MNHIRELRGERVELLLSHKVYRVTVVVSTPHTLTPRAHTNKYQITCENKNQPREVEALREPLRAPLPAAAGPSSSSFRIDSTSSISLTL